MLIFINYLSQNLKLLSLFYFLNTSLYLLCSGKHSYFVSTNNRNNVNKGLPIPMSVLSAAAQVELQRSKRYIPKDTSNLELDFCNNCNIYLGGLFPVHAPKYMRQTSENLSQTYHGLSNLDRYFMSNINCGEIKKERGIQRLEAMLFAIDLINNSTSLLPYIKLGAKIYDTCDRDTIAVEKCLNFVNDYFLLNNENIVNDFVCENDNSLGTRRHSLRNSSTIPKKKFETIYKRKVIGVIGAASSSVSIQVANLLRLFKVPQISYASTSPELSNKERFPFFSRVLPSDTLQAEAMATVVNSFDWNYVAVINEEGNLGGIDKFKMLAKKRKICIQSSYTLSQTASEDDVKLILKDMYKQQARGVIVFLQDHNIRKLLEIVNNLNMTGHFYWIASDSWGTKKESINSNDLAAEGAITFSPKSYEIKQFNEYFKNLKPNTNLRNPWFKEFWEEQFNCTMSSNVSHSNNVRISKRVCSGEENLNFSADGFIHFVIDSVFAMAHAIQNVMQVNCANLYGKELIDCHHSTQVEGTELLKAIRNVEFTSVYGRTVRFVKDNQNEGDGLAPLEVFQYQQYEPGKFGYKRITEWEKDKSFSLDVSKLKWLDGTNKVPRSVCKEDCLKGEIKQGDDCCWVCVKCEENEFVAENRKECIKCEQGYGPDESKTKCVKLKIEYMNLESPLSIIPIIISTIGVMATTLCIYVFIRFSETPVIKASGRELCYVLLAGIMSCYLIAFPLVTKPTFISCILTRFGVSLSLTVCLSALFTKTNRLSRIFNNSVKQVKQASYVSPKSQLVICFSIISVQLIGILVWTIVSPPDIEFDYDDAKRVILQCKTSDLELGISLAYIIFLVILCTIYAIKTRKIPENFNEAKFIGFTMYSICIIFIASITIYFGTTAATGAIKTPKNNYKIQLTTIALCLSLSATVILCCLFVPKLRIVLLKPNKNVRSKNSKVKSTFNKNSNEIKNTTSVRDTTNRKKSTTNEPIKSPIPLKSDSIKSDLKSPVTLAFKNSSLENLELVPSIGENSTTTNDNLFKSKTTINSNRNQLTVQGPTLKSKDDSTKSQNQALERKLSSSLQASEQTNIVQNLSTSENLSFKSSSEILSDENKTGSYKSKQTTPPSECYYYLVKPNFVSSNSNNETFEISRNQNKINFEPMADKTDDNLKCFLENCLNELSKNNNEYSNSTIHENSSNTTGISNNRASPIEYLTNNSISNNHLKSMNNPSVVFSDTSRLSIVQKQKTIVEKIPESNNNQSFPLSTSTFLLNGENLNDLNDFYSLKITFV